MDKETTSEGGVKTRYGVIVILTQDEEVLMSRRLDTPQYAKKWQLPNGRMHGNEASSDACVRVLERETDIKLPKDEFSFIGSLTLAQIGEFYYVYAVNIPITTTLSDASRKETKHRSDWRFFELDRAVVLDAAPGVRSMLLKLSTSLYKVKHNLDKAPTSLDKSKTQKLPVIRIPTQEQEQQFAMAQGCCDV